jgi:hypothetical protein
LEGDGFGPLLRREVVGRGVGVGELELEIRWMDWDSGLRGSADRLHGRIVEYGTSALACMYVSEAG